MLKIVKFKTICVFIIFHGEEEWIFLWVSTWCSCTVDFQKSPAQMASDLLVGPNEVAIFAPFNPVCLTWRRIGIRGNKLGKIVIRRNRLKKICTYDPNTDLQEVNERVETDETYQIKHAKRRHFYAPNELYEIKRIIINRLYYHVRQR